MRNQTEIHQQNSRSNAACMRPHGVLYGWGTSKKCVSGVLTRFYQNDISVSFSFYVQHTNIDGKFKLSFPFIPECKRNNTHLI